MKNRFSVIIATYNREEFLPVAINSVLSQTFKEYEFIIVDDGSTDRTKEIIKSYGDQIKYLYQENQGSEMSYKAGVSVADGEYLAFLDSDDYFLPNALSTYDKIIKTLDSPPLIMAAMKTFKHNQNVSLDYENPDVIKVIKYPDFLSGNVRLAMSQSRIVMQKSVFDKVQDGTGRPLARNLNDYRLMLRAGNITPYIVIKQPITLCYRDHENQSRKNIIKICEGIFYLINIVRSGKCPVGRSNFIDRYAYASGPIAEYIRLAFKYNLPGLTIKLIVNGWLMLIINKLRIFLSLFHKKEAVIYILNEKKD